MGSTPKLASFCKSLTTVYILSQSGQEQYGSLLTGVQTHGLLHLAQGGLRRLLGPQCPLA
jgi:hypothetical protein